MVADDAVMGDVDVVHHQHAVADAGDHPAAFGAAMDGGELADLVVVADFQPRGFTVVLEVLRSGAERGELKDPVARADRGGSFDNRVGTNLRLRPNPDLRADYRSRSDLGRGIQFGTPIDDGGGM